MSLNFSSRPDLAGVDLVYMIKLIIEYNDIKKDVDYNTYGEDGNSNDNDTQYLPQTCILDSGHFPALVVPLSLPANHNIKIYQNISKYIKT